MTTLNFNDLHTILPHRYPMLMVDHVGALEPGVAITARKCISGTDPCYQFVRDPGSPHDVAYPPSLILESFGQAGAILWLKSTLVNPGVLMLASVRNCLFEAEVFPGDTLEHHVRIDRLLEDTVIFSGDTWVGLRRVVHVDWLVAVIRPAMIP